MLLLQFRLIYGIRYYLIGTLNHPFWDDLQAKQRPQIVKKVAFGEFAMKATCLVSLSSHGQERNPVQEAIAIVAKKFGAEVAEQLVKGDVEVDIAITDSVAVALRWVKETERTSIIVTYYTKEQRDQAAAFAGRFPDRVSAVPYAGRTANDEMEIVPFLIKLITKKEKEYSDANTTG
ncbi:MAG: hypothetical protein ABSA74_02380 [Candidatus Staskawiczbacteria bacterium]